MRRKHKSQPAPVQVNGTGPLAQFAAQARRAAAQLGLFLLVEDVKSARGKPIGQRWTIYSTTGGKLLATYHPDKMNLRVGAGRARVRHWQQALRIAAGLERLPKTKGR